MKMFCMIYCSFYIMYNLLKINKMKNNSKQTGEWSKLRHIIIECSSISRNSLLFSLHTCVLCSGAGLPGAVPSVSGEAAGRFCSAEEGSDSRFGETQSSQGGRQDAAHVRQGHAGRDGWGRLSVTDIYLLYVVVVYIERVQLETTHLRNWKWWRESYKNKYYSFPPFVDWSVVSSGRERRLPGVGSRRDKLPSASCPSGGGGAEGAEDGQSDLRHPTGDDAGNRRTGDTNKMTKQSDSRKHKQVNVRGRNEKQKYEMLKWVNKCTWAHPSKVYVWETLGTLYIK